MAFYGSLGEVNFDNLDASIADTAVDVFVYDTRKDSDGGAWRNRTQHTSWYNETLNTATRGSRREFPAVAVIVAEADQVTIYDGDDPDLPMWMVINTDASDPTKYAIVRSSAQTISSLYALNGIICDPVSYNGLFYQNFVGDACYRVNIFYTIFGGNIVNRNGGMNFALNITSSGIVNATVNDVAMTVLPNAPIDSTTGLPIPTIAVACGTAGSANGGVSIIKDDGTVVDIIAGTGAGGYASYNVEFGSNNELIHTQAYNRAYSSINIFDNIPSSDISGSSTYTDARSYPYINSVPNIRGGVNGAETPYLHYVSNSSGDNIAFGFKSTNAKLSLLSDNKTAGTDATKSMVAYIASDYNTGWMHGDIKGAFLSDTTAESFSPSNLVTEDFSANWAGSTGGVISVSSGQLTITNTGSNGRAVSNQFATTIGKKYAFIVKGISSTGGGTYRSEVRGPELVAASLTAGTLVLYFNGTGNSTTYVELYAIGGSGVSVTYEDAYVVELEEDRSVNNKGLQVFGTITKSAVATGAELVAYGNWESDTAYLVRPYNSDTQFGTGDFYISYWIYEKDNTQDVRHFWLNHDLTSAGETSEGFSVGLWNTNFRFLGVGGVTQSGVIHQNNVWSFIHVQRVSGTLYLYINGELKFSTSYTGNVNATKGCMIGNRGPSSRIFGPHANLALMRFGASAPSAEQIKKIYEDEKVLFQENAACTLYGSSDAVTALAYDEDTDLLHVGTSSGRSDFQGLRRINNTTTAVTTAISASDGLIVEQ